MERKIRIKPSKNINSYAPTQVVREQTQALLEKYPMDIINERLIDLIGKIEKEQKESEKKFMAVKPSKNEDVVKRNELKILRELENLQSTINDLRSVPDLIRVIDSGKPLDRDTVSEEGNGVLMMFDRYDKRIPPRIAKCLNTASTAMEAVDKLARVRLKDIDGQDKEKMQETIADIKYLDQTAGLMGRLRNLFEAIDKEVMAARKAASRGDGGGRHA